MENFLIFTPSRSERAALSGKLTLLLRRRGVEKRPVPILDVEALSQYPAEQMRMLVCDVAPAGIIPVLEDLRRENPELWIIVIADSTISPMCYIRPSIQPIALLMRPLKEESIGPTLDDVLRLLPKTQPGQPEGSRPYFEIELRGHLQRIPMQEIQYFESRNKKLILHLRRREIPFCGTLEKLETELPSTFLRTHKSFIVNTECVAEVQYGQNLVILEGDAAIPISRSYKPKVKEVFS